jgi:hypothetical protein
VQIANVSNISVFAHCFYLNGAPLDPTMPPSASNPRVWLAVDFFVELTPQQPVFWLVSTGRMMPPGGGDVPPAVQPFTGELRCIQSDASLAPIGGNALTGNATLLGPGPEVAEYDAIALRALNVSSGTTLNLDGVEYEACTETLHAVHRADGPSIIGAQGIITSRNLLTVIPCTVDYNSEIPIRSLFSAVQHDEFELALSTIQVLDYWNEYDLGAIFPSGLTGGFRYTSTVSPTMTCIDGLTDAGQTCSTDAQCPSGVCRAVPVLAILEKQTTRPGVPTTLSDEDVQGAGSLPTAFIQMPVGP